MHRTNMNRWAGGYGRLGLKTRQLLPLKKIHPAASFAALYVSISVHGPPGVPGNLPDLTPGLDGFP